MILDSMNICMWICVLFIFILLYLCETDIMSVIVCMFTCLYSVFACYTCRIYIALVIKPHTRYMNNEQLCVNHSPFSSCFHNLHPILCQLGDWCWGRELRFKMGLVNTNFPAAGGREMGPRKTKMTMEQKHQFSIGDTTHLQTVVFLFVTIVMLVFWSVLVSKQWSNLTGPVFQMGWNHNLATISLRIPSVGHSPKKWRGYYLQIIYGSCFFQNLGVTTVHNAFSEERFHQFGSGWAQKKKRFWKTIFLVILSFQRFLGGVMWAGSWAMYFLVKLSPLWMDKSSKEQQWIHLWKN